MEGAAVGDGKICKKCLSCPKRRFSLSMRRKEADGLIVLNVLDRPPVPAPNSTYRKEEGDDDDDDEEEEEEEAR